MESAEWFFDFAAEVGLTKHIGSLPATDELADLCRIGRGAQVLDVGCGVGATPVYLAKTRGCRVVGVDISPRMIERAAETAARAGLSDKIELRVADAQDLPFEKVSPHPTFRTISDTGCTPGEKQPDISRIHGRSSITG